MVPGEDSAQTDAAASVSQALPPFLSLRPGIEGKAADRGRKAPWWSFPKLTPFIHRKAESKMKGAGKINQYRLTFCPAGLGDGVVRAPSEGLLGSSDRSDHQPGGLGCLKVGFARRTWVRQCVPLSAWIHTDCSRVYKTVP